jgi:hypothetical protein
MALTKEQTLKDRMTHLKGTTWWRRANHKQRTWAANLLQFQTHWDLKRPVKIDRGWLAKNHPNGRKYVKPAQAEVVKA